MKKTKIVCTMGPNSNDENIMRRLVKEGMDIARFNFSHGSHEEQKGRMDMLKKIREEEKKPVAILLDTKGPEIRTGVLKDGKKVLLKEGETITLTNEEIEGDETKVSLTYKGLVDDVQIGNMILIDDGLIGLKVKEKTETDIICTIVNGGELGERKGVNVPNVPVRLPAIAASFVRNAECILEIRSYLNKCGAPYIPIIAKIENSEGIDNIDEIIRCADGIMVARGDLGVEIPAEEVPYLQKLIIQKCNDNYKPVITATQMLDSMIRNPRPTRAEVGDVANAVEHRMRNASSALAYATVTTARNLKAACIITPTVSGATARVVSKFKPKTEIIGISPNEDTLRRMQIYWGVRPYCSINANSTDEICSSALDLVRAKQIAETGDTVVLTAGIPSPNISGNVAGVSNIMKIAVID